MEDAKLAETTLAILRGELGWVLHSVQNAAHQAERTGSEPEFPICRLAVVRAFDEYLGELVAAARRGL